LRLFFKSLLRNKYQIIAGRLEKTYLPDFMELMTWGTFALAT
jgi:hypothetical protein